MHSDSDSDDEPTPEDIIDRKRRDIARQSRHLEVDRMRLVNSEAALKAQIKHAAAKGDVQSAKIKATELAMNRKQAAAIGKSVLTLKGVEIKVKSVGTVLTTSNAMKSASEAMGTVTRQLDAKGFMKVMEKLDKDTDMIATSSEMIEEKVAEFFEGDNTEEDADNIVNSIFDELGIETEAKMKPAAAAVKTKTTAPSEAASSTESSHLPRKSLPVVDEEVDALHKRLTALGINPVD